MRPFSFRQTLLSAALKITAAASAVTGTVLSAAAGRTAFMGGSFVFRYFTIQSNLLLAFICVAGLVFLFRKKPVPAGWFTVKFAGTVSITLTGLVFTFMLAPLLGARAWSFPNTLTHAVVPVCCITDFFVTGVNGDIPRRKAVYGLLPPLAYVIYAGIAYVLGWEFAPGVRYPYFFLNWGSPAGAFGFSSELPFLGTVWWILILLLLLLGISALYLHLLDRLRARIYPE